MDSARTGAAPAKGLPEVQVALLEHAAANEHTEASVGVTWIRATAPAVGLEPTTVLFGKETLCPIELHGQSEQVPQGEGRQPVALTDLSSYVVTAASFGSSGNRVKNDRHP